MSFAPDDEMIETLAPDRSDQPFSEAILPRRSRCDGLVPYAHGMQTAGDDGAVDAIPIADNVVRGLVPRESLGQLARDPFGGRIGRHVDPDEVSPVQPDDDEGVEQVEANAPGQRIDPWQQCPARGCAGRCAIPDLAVPAT